MTRAMERPRRQGKSYRDAMIAKIHVAKKQLRLDDDTYQAMLENVTGKRSASALSDRQLADVIERLKTLGFKPLPKARPNRPRPSKDLAAAMSKVKALWISLHHLCVLRDSSDAALDAMARRVTGGQATGTRILEWLDLDGLYKLTEALKKMAEREAGVDWSAYRTLADGTYYDPRRQVLEAQCRIIGNLSTAAGVWIGMDFPSMTEAEQDEQIVALGALIRRYLSSLGHATLAEYREASGWRP